MRVVCLGTIGNFAALSVDPRHLKKEVCMAETLCGICKTRTATVIENKTDKLCSRCYYSRYMFRLPKSQSSRRRASFPVDSSYYYMGIGNCWQSAITGNRWQSGNAGNRQSQAIGNRRESQRECGNAQGMQGIGNVGNTGIGNPRESRGIPGNRHSAMQESTGNQGMQRQLAIVGNHGESQAIGNYGNS